MLSADSQVRPEARGGEGTPVTGPVCLASRCGEVAARLTQLSSSIRASSIYGLLLASGLQQSDSAPQTDFFQPFP